MTGKPRRTRVRGWAWVYGVLFGPDESTDSESADDTETGGEATNDGTADPDDRGSTER